jgi:hypothetical protein
MPRLPHDLSRKHLLVPSKQQVATLATLLLLTHDLALCDVDCSTYSIWWGW